MFETDVSYSGRNITKLFQSYDPSTDFITQDCHDPGGWMHGTASTPEFQKLRGEGDGLANIKAALEVRTHPCDVADLIIMVVFFVCAPQRRGARAADGVVGGGVVGGAAS